MKYLKVYKLFETSSDVGKWTDLESKVKEAFYNVSDYGLRIDIEKVSELFNGGLIVTISNVSVGDPIDFNKIKDDMDSAISYISDKLNLKLIYIDYLDEDGSGVELEDDVLVEIELLFNFK